MLVYNCIDLFKLYLHVFENISNEESNSNELVNYSVINRKDGNR